MKVLITGATGFLGEWICRRVVSGGHEVRALVRPGPERVRPASPRVTRVFGDVTDLASLQRAVEGCDWAVHAAADLNYWRQDPARQLLVNVEGTRNLARACRQGGIQRLLHVSSVAAIGIPAGPVRPADESFAFNLQDSGLVYHLSKRRSEEVLREEIARGLDAVVVNPASVTSPERMARLLRSVRRSPLVTCFSGGNCVAHVADVAEGIYAALLRGASGERYILGGENLTFRAMGERAACAMALRRRFIAIPPAVTAVASAVCEPWGRWRRQPPKFAHMIHYCANRFLFYDSSKARRELDYRPRDFDAILQEALRHQTKGDLDEAA